MPTSLPPATRGPAPGSPQGEALVESGREDAVRARERDAIAITRMLNVSMSERKSAYTDLI